MNYLMENHLGLQQQIPQIDVELARPRTNGRDQSDIEATQKGLFPMKWARIRSEVVSRPKPIWPSSVPGSRNNT